MKVNQVVMHGNCKQTSKQHDHNVPEKDHSTFLIKSNNSITFNWWQTAVLCIHHLGKPRNLRDRLLATRQLPNE